MIVTGWKNGSVSRTGSGYGIRLLRKDRDEHFSRTWKSVLIFMEGDVAEVTLSNSFWQSCVELRCSAIGKWMLNHNLAPWEKGCPPRMKLEVIAERQFRLERLS